MHLDALSAGGTGCQWLAASACPHYASRCALLLACQPPLKRQLVMSVHVAGTRQLAARCAACCANIRQLTALHADSAQCASTCCPAAGRPQVQTLFRRARTLTFGPLIIRDPVLMEMPLAGEC